jgi:hypothetical protein
MSTTELSQLEALLGRVVPDPMGFAERVFQQMVDRLATELPGGGAPRPGAANGSIARDALADRNVLLAAAVGACDCWGLNPDCAICSGEGSAGWLEPDARLYAEFVEPAVRRSGSARDDSSDQPPKEGDLE